MLKASAPRALSVLWIMAGFTFSLHGLQKLSRLFGGMGGKGATAAFGSLIWTAGGAELSRGLQQWPDFA